MQASQLTPGATDADKVVDGNMNADMATGSSCSSTASGRNDAEWWAVYLVDTYTVTDVVLVNRGDCCGESAHPGTAAWTLIIYIIL